MEGILNDGANEILTKYLEMFQHNCYDFQYYFAQNSVIDWYGRQIRGVQKIHNHLRYEVFLHFEHSEFREAKVCDPIETKPTHKSTQKLISATRKNTHLKKPKSVAVTLKSHADSDLESEDHDHDHGGETAVKEKITPLQTLETLESKPCDLASEEKMPPLNMKRGLDTSPLEDCTVKFCKYYKDQKYVNTALIDSFSCLPRIPSNSCIVERNNSSDDSSSEDDDLKQIEYTYTPLQYLEAIGTLTVRPAKIKEHIDNYSYVNGTQRETRLRISYRRNIKNKEIQFALVIYEDICPTTERMNPRRNLLSEFSLLADNDHNDGTAEEHDKHSPSTAKAESPSTHLQNMSTTVLPILQIDPEDLEPPVMMSIAQMCTPTKQTLTPAATPKRCSRSSMRRNSVAKRLNNSPKTTSNKRSSAARSLRL